jgi:hypothetical protein
MGNPLQGLCVISPYKPGKRGYPRMRKNGKTVYCHRAAWEDKHGPIPGGLCVLHKCDNPRCVNVDHLFLGTRPDNSSDMVQKDRSTHGELNPRAKLNTKQVAEIKASNEPTSILVRRFNVSRATIKYIRSGKTWRRIGG